MTTVPDHKPEQDRIPAAVPKRQPMWRFLIAGQQRNEIFMFLAVYVVLYFFLRDCYPDPLCLTDSFGYVMSAVELAPNLFRPIGYSYCLAFLYNFSPTVDFVIFAQYWASAIMVLVTLFTIKYFYSPARNILFRVLGFCIVLSPTVSFMNLWFLSDGIFFTCVLLWISSLIFVIERKSIAALIVHALSLYAMIYLRHTGLIFPVLSCIIFIARFRIRSWYMCALCLAMMLVVIAWSKQANLKCYGANNFSGFAAWNQANNVLSIMPYVNVDTTKMKDPEIRLVHKVISRLDNAYFSEDSILSANMIWRPHHSLHDVQAALASSEYYYMSRKRLFFKTADILSKYNTYMVKHYPGAYFQHFILRNALQMLHFDAMHQLKPEDRFLLQQASFYMCYDVEKEYFEVRNNIYDQLFNPIAGFAVTFWTVSCIIIAVLARKRGVLQPAWQSGKYFILALLVFIVMYGGFSVIASVIIYRYMYPVAVFLVMLAYMLLRKDTFQRTV